MLYGFSSPLVRRVTVTTATIPYWINPFIITRCPSISLVTVFVLESVFCDIDIATPAFFSFPFAWNIFFPSPHFSVSVCFQIWSESLVGRKYVGLGFYLFSHSISFSWSIGPFTFKVNIDRYVLIAILLIVFRLFYSSFLFFFLPLLLSYLVIQWLVLYLDSFFFSACVFIW